MERAGEGGGGQGGRAVGGTNDGVSGTAGTGILTELISNGIRLPRTDRLGDSSTGRTGRADLARA